MAQMDEELEQLLKNLHLKKILEILDEELRIADEKQHTYAEFAVRLLRAQWHFRQESALDYRIKQARLPEKWTLETFPFNRQPGVSRRKFRTFAELDFIDRAENIVLIGGTGVGKTGLATGLLLKALQSGYRGIFLKAQDLFDEMYASLADRSSRKLINRLGRIDVMVVDEMGYLNLRPEQTNVFFRLMEERYHRKSTIITTNLEYDEWHNFLGNRALCDALLSRLRHQCHTVRIEGPSLREPSE
jgi:DNA replication protein DnaC